VEVAKSLNAPAKTRRRLAHPKLHQASPTAPAL
jgi:hypothetical protein